MAPSHSYSVPARCRAPWPDTHGRRDSGVVGGRHPGATRERELQARPGRIWVDPWSSCGTYFRVYDGQIRTVPIHWLYLEHCEAMLPVPLHSLRSDRPLSSCHPTALSLPLPKPGEGPSSGFSPLCAILPGAGPIGLRAPSAPSSPSCGLCLFLSHLRKVSLSLEIQLCLSHSSSIPISNLPHLPLASLLSLRPQPPPRPTAEPLDQASHTPDS